jgi:hypothetical protein
MKLLRSSLPVLALGLFLTACGDDGPTEPVVDDPMETRVVKDNPSFATDVLEIFARKGCTAGSCHGNGAGGMTLSSTASVSYGSLVNIASPATGEIRVIPGNANDSYLVKKLEGRQSAGAQMPLGGVALDNIDLSNIKNWINQGAQNN